VGSCTGSRDLSDVATRTTLAGLTLSTVRAALIANPFATSTHDGVLDALTAAVAAEHDVTLMPTAFRGHAMTLAKQAREEGVDFVIALGGDGTVNEVVNGVLSDTDPASPIDLAALPTIVVIPGGSANVVARGLGIPADPAEATSAALKAIREGSSRSLSIGHITWWDQFVAPPTIAVENQRWVVFSSGLGLDAEVIEAMETERAAGRRATPARYAQLTLRQWLGGTNRRHAGLVVSVPGRPPMDAFVTIICLTSPWTYVGPIAIDPVPEASYDTGLDLVAIQDLSLGPVSRMAARMVTGTGLEGLKGVKTAHDQPEVHVHARRLTALHVDGDLVGHIRGARISSVPNAIRIAVPA
jgi:diacylglycerol kinase family enzyme